MLVFRGGGGEMNVMITSLKNKPTNQGAQNSNWKLTNFIRAALIKPTSDIPWNPGWFIGILRIMATLRENPC